MALTLADAGFAVAAPGKYVAGKVLDYFKDEASGYIADKMTGDNLWSAEKGKSGGDGFVLAGSLALGGLSALRGGVAIVGNFRKAAEGTIPTIGGRLPINSKYAGQVHPSGVEFTDQGFPNFRPYSQAEVEIPNLTGKYGIDSRLANEAMGYPSTPKGYVWHHVEDGATMQLIPKAVHNSVRHTGGAAVIRNGGFD